MKQISLISQGQHNSVLRRLGRLLGQVHENLPISAGGGGDRAGLGRGRAIGCFPRSPIGPCELRPHQPRWTRATPLGGHSWPHNALRGASLGAAGPSATGTARPLFPASSGGSGIPAWPLAPRSVFCPGLTGTARVGAGPRRPRSLEGRVCGSRVAAT